MELLAGEKAERPEPSQELYDGRHSRTIRLVGEDAVEKLWKSKVFVAGLGGVGSYVVEALARAGVGSFVVAANAGRQLKIMVIAKQNNINFFIKTDSFMGKNL